MGATNSAEGILLILAENCHLLIGAVPRQKIPSARRSHLNPNRQLCPRGTIGRGELLLPTDRQPPAHHASFAPKSGPFLIFFILHFWMK
jgi:hypothetical protein